MRLNVLAILYYAVDVIGDVDKLLLDKTDIIKPGNRQITELLQMHDIIGQELADAAQLTLRAGEMPDSRSIVVIDKEYYASEHATWLAALPLRAFYTLESDERRRVRHLLHPQ